MIQMYELKRNFLLKRGFREIRDGVWIHPDIVYEDDKRKLKRWSTHEAYMYEVYDVWVSDYIEGEPR